MTPLGERLTNSLTELLEHLKTGKAVNEKFTVTDVTVHEDGSVKRKTYKPNSRGRTE